MVNSSLVRRRAAENLGLPGVQVRVKMNHRDSTVGTVDRAQEGQDDGMVASQSDDTGVMLSVGRDRYKWFAGDGVVPKGRKRVAMEKSLVSVFDLLDGVLVVVRRHRYVSTVDHLKARHKRVHGEGNVVAAVESQATGACPDASGAKACAGAVRGSGVLNSLMSGCSRKRRENTYKRRTDEGYVESGVLVLAKALNPWEFRKRGDPREDGIRGH